MENDKLKVMIKYNELEATIEGEYNEVWKFINDFFKQIKLTIGRSSIKSSIITTDKKSVPEILIELRNSGFFNEPKSSKECFNRIKELGKTDITLSAVQMALKNLVKKGELKRILKGKSFVYVAPYIDTEA